MDNSERKIYTDSIAALENNIKQLEQAENDKLKQLRLILVHERDFRHRLEDKVADLLVMLQEPRIPTPDTAQALLELEAGNLTRYPDEDTMIEAIFNEIISD